MITKERIVEELETIYDPEINLDIYTLGLIRDIIIKDDTIDILMTYTTVACPVGPLIQHEIRDALLTLEGIKRVNIEVTFEPPWKAPENLRAMMGV